jgi:Family of unknown function (DUF6159)
MFDRLGRSWSLIKASAAIVRSNKSLLLFPIVSGIATIVIVVLFLLPLADGWDLDRSSSAGETTIYVWLGLLYLTLYFVSLFFNTALVSVALLRLTGSPGGVGDGFARAATRLPAIFGYALLAASVGVLLRMIEERAGWIGRITAGLIGLTWTVATFLVVPTLAARDVGPIEALTQSATLLKRTWGENIAGNAGIGFVFTLVYISIVVGTIALLAGIPTQSPEILVAIVVTAVTLLLAMIILHSALQGVYAAALYCYATSGEAATGFQAAALDGAFRNRRP